MFYSVELSEFPVITRYYSVTRNTVWGVNTNENILILITKGRCRFSVDTEEFVANTNDAVFIPANHSYTRSAVENELCSMIYIHFYTKKEAKFLEDSALSESLALEKQRLDSLLLSDTTLKDCPSTVYLHVLNHIEDTAKTDGYLKDINLFSVSREFTCLLQSGIALCGILAYLSLLNVNHFRSSYDTTSKLEFPTNLKKAIGYIRKNHSRHITLDELALYCNVSKQQIIRYFKSTFGTTPINYILEYKISKAKEYMLFQSHLSVKEIALELGFDNQHYFSRIFKKITGETPSEYKYRVKHYVPPKEENASKS